MSAEASLGATAGGRPLAAPRLAARVAAAAGSAVVAAPALALLTVAIQGFSYGEVNNAFQAPIVLGMPSWPQFRHDWFYQSLGAYSSALWPMLAALGPAFGTRAAFLALHLAARAATFAGVWLLMKRLGVGVADRWLVCLVLATSALMLWPSPVGVQAIFDDYFTHDAVAWALTVFTWLLVAEGRLGVAVGLTGPTFAISAFTAVWNALALGVAGLSDGLVGDGAARLVRLRQFAIRIAVGAAVALLVASPAIVWTARTALAQSPQAFDYAAFLWRYFPRHFFIAASSPADIANLAGMTLAGAAALWRLGRTARPLLGLFAGYGAVFALGVVLPSLTHARLFLNLHLLRVDGSLEVMAIIASVIVALGDLRRGASLVGRLAGALVLYQVVLGAMPGPLMAAGVIVPVLVSLRPSSIAAGLPPWSIVGAVAVLFIAAAGARIELATQSDSGHQRTAEEARVGAWLRANTPADAVLLSRPAVKPGLDGLQFFGQRQVWVDWKRGAAVMWRPDLYPVWRQRMDEVAGLATLDQGARYACAHRLRYMVELAHDVGPGAPGKVVYRDDLLAVIDLAGACPASGAA
jgi:hypothetical protein